MKKSTKLQLIPAIRLVILKRNPQFLTPPQMEALKASIKRDGFVVPVLVRPIARGRFEVISGNHRFMAAQELKLSMIPCVVSRMTERDAKRLAVNLNTIHGEPNAELLAPFLAEMDESLLREIHIEEGLMGELIAFDDELAKRLKELEPPAEMDRAANKNRPNPCKCPKCGTVHTKPNE